MKLFRRAFRKLINKIFASSSTKADSILMMNGIQCMHSMLSIDNLKTLNDTEFKVYSQWGEDGIIAYLVSKLNIENNIFIEFGVENYTESNTRFLLKQFNWSGLVIDGSKENIDYIKKDEIMWKYNLTPLQAFITKDNINDLISSYTTEKDIGLLSIDIDGNDYWIWESIEVINPRIVICEYNNLFGGEQSVTIPYDPFFVRNELHYSNLYFGCSISALKNLATKKGYSFVGSNSAGNNAFFIRNDLREGFPLEVKNDFIESRFRESRNKNGDLNFFDRASQLNEIKHLQLLDIESNNLDKISKLFSI
jgi:hypothetical protein